MDTPVYILDASFILLRLSHALPLFRNYFLSHVSTLTCSFAFRIDFLFLYSCLSLWCHSSLNFTYCPRVIGESSGQSQLAKLDPCFLTFHSFTPTSLEFECMLTSCIPALSTSNLFRSFSSKMALLSSSAPVDLLILGAGWTSSFLIPHLQSVHPSISFASTTRDGRNESIKWEFNPDSNDPAQYDSLPAAKTVLITFPIKGQGGSRNLVEGYEKSKGSNRARWIQLGSTGIWDVR